jgi:2-oxoglutarate ferredoxin oxidoreductase subunit gamma
MKRYEIRLAGFGGQGIVTAGRVLGTAISMYEGKNSVNTQSYGPESRGGACRSEVVVSDGEIYYPSVRKADLFVALSQAALDAYIGDLKPGGVLIVDPDVVELPADHKHLVLVAIPTLELAQQAGGAQVQNMVALGALSTLLDWISPVSCEKAIAECVPAKTLAANLRAFWSGREFLAGQSTERKSVPLPKDKRLLVVANEPEEPAE